MTETARSVPGPRGADRIRPVRPGARNTYLDLIRGVAVLVILVMNVVSFGLGPDAYFDLSAGGSETWLDWLVAGAGEIFVDQKFMGLFSILFGAGVALFSDRAADKGRRPVRLGLWRNLLLLIIGILHARLWEGDILIVYALASPLVVLLRNRTPRALIISGVSVTMLSPLAAVLLQPGVSADAGTAGPGLSLWEHSEAAGVYLLLDALARSIGMMLIGVALYRRGIITGDRPDRFYRRMAATGLGTGLPLAALGLALTAAAGFSTDLILVGAIPNTLGTIPATLGYMSLLVLWNRRPESSLRRRLGAAGRMALTNYLTQTLLGVLILGWLAANVDLTRTMLVGFTAAVWSLQLWWSAAWLVRFRYGPAEWLWRTATYWRRQPLRVARTC